MHPFFPVPFLNLFSSSNNMLILFTFFFVFGLFKDGSITEGKCPFIPMLVALLYRCYFFYFCKSFRIASHKIVIIEFLVCDPFLSKIVFSQHLSIWAVNIGTRDELSISVEMGRIVDESTWHLIFCFCFFVWPPRVVHCSRVCFALNMFWFSIIVGCSHGKYFDHYQSQQS